MGLTDGKVVDIIINNLDRSLLTPKYKQYANPAEGFVYILAEAIYRVLGHNRLTPYHLIHENICHVFLKTTAGAYIEDGLDIIDPLGPLIFTTPVPYDKAEPFRFSATHTSKRVTKLINRTLEVMHYM